MAAKVKILEALADASAEDLAEIEAEIVKLEKKLASLRAAKSLVDVAINGKQKRAAQVRRPPWADKIMEFLRTNGPSAVRQVADSLGCSTAVIYASAPKEKCVLDGGLLRIR